MKLERYFLALGHLLPVFATPTLRAVGIQDVHIVLEAEKESSLASIAIWNSAQSDIIAKSCSNSLDSGPFKEHPVRFSVNELGSGTLQVGNSSYLIGGGTAANAIDCGRVVSEHELAVHCVVPIPSSLGLKPLNKRELTECFTDGLLGIGRAIAVLDGRVATSSSTHWQLYGPETGKTTQDITKRMSLERRQDCVSHGEYTELIPMQCPNNAACVVQQGQARSFSIGFSVGGTVSNWISGGFSVVTTIETGTSWYCNGNPGDYLAIWKSQAQTAYTVRNYIFNTCGPNTRLDNGIIWSPNANDRGSYFYCVYGKNFVRNVGDRWLDTSPNNPGGPP